MKNLEKMVAGIIEMTVFNVTEESHETKIGFADKKIVVEIEALERLRIVINMEEANAQVVGGHAYHDTGWAICEKLEQALYL